MYNIISNKVSWLENIMKVCIIVDGYNAGREFPSVLSERGIYSIHVQSTENVISAFSKFDENNYLENIIYTGNLEETVAEIERISDIETVLGVIAGSEPGVYLADLLSERLGLETSNGTALSTARRNKFDMLEAIKSAGLPTPLYFASCRLKEINDWVIQNTRFPVVLKPLESAGTDGVFICHNFSEIERAFNKIMQSINLFEVQNQSVLVESFLHGNEYVVNSVSCHGKHKVNDIWIYKKQEVEGRKIYDREELLDFHGDKQEALINYAHQVLDAVGIKFGPSHAEIMLTESGPVIVEVGARISGATNIRTSQECVGHDVVNLTIDSYISHAAFMRAYETPNKIIKYSMVVDLANTQEGVIIAETITSQLSSLPSLKNMVIKKSSGDYLVKTKDLMSSPAKFHLAHESQEQLMRDYETIQTVGRNGFVLQLEDIHSFDSSSDDIKTEEQHYASPGSSFASSISSFIMHSFWGSRADSLESPEERSAVKVVSNQLQRLSIGWTKRAGVMKYDSTEKELPDFDLTCDDFLEELLPFHHHPIYQHASNELKQRVLTYAWILYNQKTIAIETDVVSPACTSIINDEVPGLKDRHSKLLAAESMTDEAFHTLLVTQAIEITKENRDIHVTTPSFSLIRNLKKAQDNYEEPWKKMLILVATAIVSEIFISDYLKLLSESEHVQPINRITVTAHRLDELNHSKIFKLFAKQLYLALTHEQKIFFAEILPKPIYWFADKELDTWDRILQEISFPGAEEMISDCREEQNYHLEYIDYTGLEALAEELGIENFTETMYQVEKKPSVVFERK